jgi:hypothetical protein
MMIQEKIRQESLANHVELRAEDPLSVARPNASDSEVAGLSGPFGNSTQQEKLESGEEVVADRGSEDLVPRDAR